MTKSAKLTYNGKEIELPVLTGTENEDAIDISKIRSETGLITLDKGYKNTGATTSKITYLDGEKGILRHRGYSIEELASKSTFTEVCYLLIYGELPTQEQLDSFEHEIRFHTLVHEDFKIILEGYPSKAHPMGVLSSLITSLTAFYPESLDPSKSKDLVDLSISRILGKFPTFAAWSFKKRNGHPIIYPDNSLDYCSNFLKMMFELPSMPYEPNPVVTDALNTLLILHADHEQNCSTSTVRIVGSAQSSIYPSISAGINALWGPLHGGANQAVIEMLDTIMNDNNDIDKYIKKAKDKSDPFRLMGFGHRVYKNFDPRAKIIKKAADNVLEKLGVDDPVLELAKKLEKIALEDEYFVEKKLYPNVDFYSGIIYRALGFPPEMFTVMFAFGRLPGWISQWVEMRQNKEPLGRPRQIYLGENARSYINISER
ncbi:MAG: citrate synthase [Cytophagales bacterium]|nr:citrate (Si)-synthase [Marinoscillum sp.]OUX26450.1 MAG: citrate (Si)-synthase [Flammeovirgaceae bacterium TMED262]PDH43781.1 MAG: citrate (Si)-synthase [Rhodothermaeota bacterium MED-G18]